MVAVVVALVATLAAPAPHATLIASEPAANAVLAASPPRLRLVFSEPIETRLGSLVLVGPDRVDHRLTPNADPHDVHAIVAPLGELTSGEYRVDWRVVSADGHPVSGSFLFTVGNDDVHATMPPPSDSGAGIIEPTRAGVPVLAAALRGLALASLLALAGLLALSEWVLPDTGGGVARATGWLAAASLVFLALHLAAWLANVGMSTGTPVEDGILTALMESGAGRRELLRVGGALLALWALLLARRRGVAALFALGAVLVSGAIGHPAAVHPSIAIPVKAIHLLAGAIWLGGLLWIVLAVPTHPRFTNGVYRVSSLALGAVVCVALTGVAQLLLFLPGAAALVRSRYGLLALAKIAGLFVLVGLGAYHRYALLPRIGTDVTPAARLQTSVRGEIAVMILVILLGGLLAYVPPTGP